MAADARGVYSAGEAGEAGAVQISIGGEVGRAEGGKGEVKPAAQYPRPVIFDVAMWTEGPILQ